MLAHELRNPLAPIRTAAEVLARRLIHDDKARYAAEVVKRQAALVGLAIAAWVRVHLRRYWSDKVVIQPDHRLVSSGPYARMRHPIYFGVLLAIAGTATVVGEWRALLAFLLMLINYTIKARKEDQILADRLTRNSSTTRIVVGISCRAFGCVEVTRLSLF